MPYGKVLDLFVDINVVALLYMLLLQLKISQAMRITIEIDSKNEIEQLSALFKTLHTVKVISSDEKTAPIIKGDKKIDPTSLFGIWGNNPRSLEEIRKEAWERNPHDR